MAISLSTGFAYHVNTQGSVKDALEGGSPTGCLLKIYKGTIPLVDEAVSGSNLLLTLSESDSGDGMTLEGTTGSRTLYNTSTETWSGTVSATGVATYYRLARADDTGAASTSQQRVQGVISDSIDLADLYMSNTTLTSGEVKTLTAYALTLRETI